ncbi:protein-L-isoaspartate carboxylmethyltransferase [Dehalococcoidia bacterium]|nr:protein-L-isoaspartate carboxylmethyltransferase [Dehalococcoidia bacterium]
MDHKTVFIGQLENALTRLPPLASLYSRPYLGVVEREVKLAAIGDGDVVVNIGCGGVPFTATYLARLTGAKVIALDRDRKAAECALRYVKASGLADIIRVAWGDGAQASECGSATVWIVALQAAPKKAILKHFQKSAPRGARIIFREPRPAFANRYDQLPRSARPQFAINHKMVTFNRSVLFTQGT